MMREATSAPADVTLTSQLGQMCYNSMRFSLGFARQLLKLSPVLWLSVMASVATWPCFC
jgi:hypothetical protein